MASAAVGRCMDSVVSCDCLYAFQAMAAPGAVSVDAVVSAAAELVAAVAVVGSGDSIAQDIAGPTQGCGWRGYPHPFQRISEVP